MNRIIHRREFLQAGAAAAVTGAAARALAAEEEQSVEPVRIGVVGVGGRGRSHVSRLLSSQQNVVIPAICDYRKDRLAAAIDIVKKLKGYAPDGYSKDEHDYRNMLQRDDLDAVLVATDVFWLGRISIDALKAGKHAGSEVTGCHTVDECWELVKAQQSSDKYYMLLENCSYGRETLAIYNMIRQGVLGEPYFAVGSYLHDCKNQYFEADGKLTWRGRLMRDEYGSCYPAHGMGSIAKWMGINDGDRMEYCTAMGTSPRQLHAYAVERFGPESGPAKVDFKLGDFVTVLIQTAHGKQLRLDASFSSSRPYSRYYLVQGTKGCYDSRWGLYLQGITKTSYHGWHRWDSLSDYYDKWEHPYWRKEGDKARAAGGHGGIDYLCVRDFVKMVREDRKPWIDAYDCAAWSSLLELSRLSIDRKGAPVEIPDFTEGRWKDPDWRRDQMV